MVPDVLAIHFLDTKLKLVRKPWKGLQQLAPKGLNDLQNLGFSEDLGPCVWAPM